MSWLKNLGKQIDLRADHRALSAARFTFFLFLFLDWGQLYLNRHISVSGGQVGAMLLATELFVMLCVMFGLFTRTALIANFILVQILDRYYLIDLYHLDYALYNISFIMLFSPSPRAWSLDSYFAARRGRPREPVLLPRWFTVLFFFGIELVYFGSLFYKYNTQIWTRGLGFWFPSALPHFCTGLYPEWAEIAFLVQGASFFALFFETAFPLVLFGKLRRAFGLCCFALHVGIAVFFPIPFFGLAVCGLSLFFIMPRPPMPGAEGALPEPSSSRVVTILGWTLCGFMAFSQMVLTFANQRPWIQPLQSLKALMIEHNRIMGVYDHALYSDFHFRSEPLVRFTTQIDGREVVIPCYDQEGYPERSGRFWAISNFFLRWDLQRRQPHPVLRRFVEGWFLKRGLTPQPVRVEYKRIRYPLELDFEIDDRIRAEPWREAGVMRLDERGRLRAEWTPRFAIERMGVDAVIGESAAALEDSSQIRYAIELTSPESPPRLLVSAAINHRATIAVVHSDRVVAELMLGSAVLPPAMRGEAEAYRVVERRSTGPRLIKPELVGPPTLTPTARGVLRGGVLLYPTAAKAAFVAQREGARLRLSGPCPSGAELLGVFRGERPLLVTPVSGQSFDLVLEEPGGAEGLRVFVVTRQGAAAEYALSRN